MKKGAIIGGIAIVFLLIVYTVISMGVIKRPGNSQNGGGFASLAVEKTVKQQVNNYNKENGSNYQVDRVEVSFSDSATAEAHVFYKNSCSDIFTYQKKDKGWDMIDMRPGPDCPSQRDLPQQQASSTIPSGATVEGRGWIIDVPGDVIKKFYNALANKQYLEAGKYATPEFIKDFDKDKNYSNIQIKIYRFIITGDNDKMELEYFEGKEGPYRIFLKKTPEGWKIVSPDEGVQWSRPEIDKGTARWEYEK